jgi:hypothetical protein
MSDSQTKKRISDLIDMYTDICKGKIKLEVRKALMWVAPEGVEPQMLAEVQRRLQNPPDISRSSEETVRDAIHEYCQYLEYAKIQMDMEDYMELGKNGSNGQGPQGQTAAPTAGNVAENNTAANTTEQSTDSGNKINPLHVGIAAAAGVAVGGTAMFFAAPHIRGFLSPKSAGEAAFGAGSHTDSVGGFLSFGI